MKNRLVVGNNCTKVILKAFCPINGLIVSNWEENRSRNWKKRLMGLSSFTRSFYLPYNYVLYGIYSKYL